MLFLHLNAYNKGYVTYAWIIPSKLVINMNENAVEVEEPVTLLLYAPVLKFSPTGRTLSTGQGILGCGWGITAVQT